MSAHALLDTLADEGIWLARDGASVVADLTPGADLAPYAEQIAANKPALLAALDLRERIIAAAIVEPAHFDRPTYDALWEQWHTENPS